MKRTIPLALLALTAACQDAVSPTSPATVDAPVAAAARADRQDIPDQYIVVLNRGAGDVAAMVDRLAASANARVLFRYTDVLQGFAARMSPEAAAAL
ncbi:MAG TPA: hypothetical protein VHM67_01900, partial [Gemmatimonadaceae bacterium]|nr:hypothetical protein [Gemmatimonadaceae bacterium]